MTAKGTVGAAIILEAQTSWAEGKRRPFHGNWTITVRGAVDRAPEISARASPWSILQELKPLT
jgi:hypothetical protein